ncbi:hypothetical protein VTN96DRAFT_10016 [Rasamsonia emersonii]
MRNEELVVRRSQWPNQLQRGQKANCHLANIGRSVSTQPQDSLLTRAPPQQFLALRSHIATLPLSLVDNRYRPVQLRRGGQKAFVFFFIFFFSFFSIFQFFFPLDSVIVIKLAVVVALAQSNSREEGKKRRHFGIRCVGHSDQIGSCRYRPVKLAGGGQRAVSFGVRCVDQRVGIGRTVALARSNSEEEGKKQLFSWRRLER